MGFSLTTSLARPSVRPLASPKTHTPLSRLQERGHRFYSTELSRWISRDPIGEMGGVGMLRASRVKGYPFRAARFVRKKPSVGASGQLSPSFDISAYERGDAIARRQLRKRQDTILAQGVMETTLYDYCRNSPVVRADYLGLMNTPVEACVCFTCIVGLEAGCTFGCTFAPDYDECLNDCLYTSTGDWNWPDTISGAGCSSACSIASLPSLPPNYPPAPTPAPAPPPYIPPDIPTPPYDWPPWFPPGA
jgi:hypothetical protein